VNRRKKQNDMTKKDFIGKFKSLYLWGNIFAMLLVVVLIVFGLKMWLTNYTHHGENIDVPNLYNMTQDAAGSLLQENGLQMIVVGESYKKELAEGRILLQDPKAGTTVKEGRIVYVTVNSLKVSKVRIPDVIGYKSYRGAQADLLDLEFELADPIVTTGPRDLVMKILCNGREVNNGDEVAKYSRLTIVIGDGKGDINGEPEEVAPLPEDVIMDEIDEDVVIEGNGDTFEVFE